MGGGGTSLSGYFSVVPSRPDGEAPCPSLESHTTYPDSEASLTPTWPSFAQTHRTPWAASEFQPENWFECGPKGLSQEACTAHRSPKPLLDCAGEGGGGRGRCLFPNKEAHARPTWTWRWAVTGSR